MNTPVQSRQNPAKVVAAVVLTLLFSFAFFWAAAPAHADDETWFNEFHVEAELGEDGRMAVTTHVEYDLDRKSTRLNSSHVAISYAVFCLKKKKKKKTQA